jgi:hypothetical protein
VVNVQAQHVPGGPQAHERDSDRRRGAQVERVAPPSLTDVLGDALRTSGVLHNEERPRIGTIHRGEHPLPRPVIVAPAVDGTQDGMALHHVMHGQPERCGIDRPGQLVCRHGTVVDRSGRELLREQDPLLGVTEVDAVPVTGAHAGPFREGR